MQTENNYDKETYNGDIGIIRSINKQDQEITNINKKFCLGYNFLLRSLISICYSKYIN